VSYLRVIPRDLFNESKLLKCLGQLALIIHDGVGVPRGLSLDHNTDEQEGFEIEQDENTGALYCSNLELTYWGRLIGLRCPYNCKDAYPLQYILDDDNDGRVFSESGVLTSEFRAMLGNIT
jgi:hypothetical protein